MYTDNSLNLYMLFLEAFDLVPWILLPINHDGTVCALVQYSGQLLISEDKTFNWFNLLYFETKLDYNLPSDSSSL